MLCVRACYTPASEENYAVREVSVDLDKWKVFFLSQVVVNTVNAQGKDTVNTL